VSFAEENAELFTLAEAAELTGVSVAMLNAEIRDGRLGAYRIRSKWIVSDAQVQAWLRRVEKPAAES